MTAPAAPRRLHLLPVVMTAAAALLALKAVGLATNTSYLFIPAAEARSAEPPPAEKPKPVEVKPPKPPEEPVVTVSPAERALLEALQKRRETLEGRASDLDLRENLMKAAEKRIEERLNELKLLEQSVSAADDKRVEQDKAKLKELITMYENMKVKEAARIFDRLESGVLLDVASRMNPRKMSEILGQMAPEAAERLTVALARRDGQTKRPAPMALGELPKIEGRPTPR